MNLKTTVADQIALLLIRFLIALLIVIIGSLIGKGVFKLETVVLHQFLGRTVDCIAGLVCLLRSFLCHLSHRKRLRLGCLTLFLSKHAIFLHVVDNFISFFQRRFRMGHRIIARRIIADSCKGSRLPDSQILSLFVKIKEAGLGHSVTAVCIEIGITVKFQDIGLGILFFHLRCRKDLRNLSCK